MGIEKMSAKGEQTTKTVRYFEDDGKWSFLVRCFIKLTSSVSIYTKSSNMLQSIVNVKRFPN